MRNVLQHKKFQLNSTPHFTDIARMQARTPGHIYTSVVAWWHHKEIPLVAFAIYFVYIRFCRHFNWLATNSAHPLFNARPTVANCIAQTHSLPPPPIPTHPVSTCMPHLYPIVQIAIRINNNQQRMHRAQQNHWRHYGMAFLDVVTNKTIYTESHYMELQPPSAPRCRFGVGVCREFGRNGKHIRKTDTNSQRCVFVCRLHCFTFAANKSSVLAPRAIKHTHTSIYPLACIYIYIWRPNSVSHTQTSFNTSSTELCKILPAGLRG